MSALNNSALIGASGSTGYQISRSVRLRSSASAYFSKSYIGGTSPADSSNYIKTYSIWFKRGALATVQDILNNYFGSTNFWSIALDASDKLAIYAQFAGTVSTNLVSTRVFRDPSAWMNVVVTIDTTQATSTNRIRAWVNGDQVTAWDTATYPAQNTTSVSFFTPGSGTWNAAIGRRGSAAQYFDGYITELNVIDGQALTPASFGETDAVTGVWKPKKYTGTYGTNGFYLNFSDNSAATAAAIGKDYSGNGNNWTPNNISVTSGVTYDSMLDVPTPWPDGGNGRGNYCTLNPLAGFGAIANGNLQGQTGTSTNRRLVGSFGVSSGKWYFEVQPTTSLTAGICIGVGPEPYPSTGNVFAFGANSYGYYSNGQKYIGGTGSAYGSAMSLNDIVGIALDLDAGTITAYLNGTSQGQLASGLSGTFFPLIGDGSGGSSAYFEANFGQRPFSYTPPSGFNALNTLNLPTPTIANGANYFAATTYTGTGASRSVDNTVNNVSFQPDFVWAKGRSGATDHALYDAVRGVQKQLETNTTTAETTETTGLTAFNSNGFTVGALAQMNTNTATYVAWQWKEGATQGFDIVTYTGNSTASRSVNHNLGVTPSMIFVKNRTTAQNNPVAHTSLAVGNLLLFDTTGASTAAGTRLRLGNSTAFTVGDAADYTITNQTGNDYVAYCFAAIAGFSAFGSYTGNGSADGPFVFCGFRPRWVMLKRTDSAPNEWFVQDTSVNTYNLVTNYLYPNSSSAEQTNGALDILSNGFKLRNSYTTQNASGGTYIYAAFAENPFKYSLAR